MNHSILPPAEINHSKGGFLRTWIIKRKKPGQFVSRKTHPLSRRGGAIRHSTMLIGDRREKKHSSILPGKNQKRSGGRGERLKDEIYTGDIILRMKVYHWMNVYSKKEGESFENRSETEVPKYLKTRKWMREDMVSRKSPKITI